MTHLTQMLSQINQGDSQAVEQLFPLVYEELRKLAAAKLAREKPGQTLQATALVHDAYIRLVDVDQVQHWQSRVHFFGAAAEAMRRILVDRAREKKAIKRGGKWERIEFSTSLVEGAAPVDELLMIDELFDGLEQEHPQEAAIAKLHYFGGFNISEAARALDVPVSSAHRYWAFARAWLKREMTSDDSDS